MLANVNPFQPSQVVLTRSESAWIANPGIIVRTRRTELFAEFAQPLGTFHDGSATFIIPLGTRIIYHGYAYEYRDGCYIVTPPHTPPQPAAITTYEPYEVTP